MQDKIKKALAAAAQLLYRDIKLPDFLVESPQNSEHGDYASNIALVLAKALRRNPMEIANEIASRLQTTHYKLLTAKTEVAQPGFINFFLDQHQLGGALKEILKKKAKFGASKNRETVIIEYSSPNIAKPMGVHHLRSTIIGQALVNIYKFLGCRVLAMSFPGDWGTQFGTLMAAYKKWGNPKKLKQDPIKEMLNLYVRFSQTAEHDEELQAEARNEFKKLEQGDKENKRVWQWFRKESFKDFNRVYKMLGINIPLVFSESFFEPRLKETIAEALAKRVARKNSDGSVIVEFKDQTPPLLLQKSDGATLYATRDLAQIKYRIKRWRPHQIIYVVANQQTLHFNQLFMVAELMGYVSDQKMIHVKFGMVLDSNGKKFATREGRLIPLETVLTEAAERARKVVDKLNPQLPLKEKQKIAQAVGVGAVKFFDLSQNRLSDIVFDWNKMLNLKGASAPYIQYSYARLKSVLRKAGQTNPRFNPDNLKTEEELVLMRQLMRFPEAAAAAAARYEPNHIAEYLLKLAEKVNHFYETAPVLKADKETRSARLALIKAATIVIKTGCELLGIEVPERM